MYLKPIRFQSAARVERWVMRGVRCDIKPYNEMMKMSLRVESLISLQKMVAMVIVELLHFFSVKVIISIINMSNAFGVNKD